MTWWLTERGLHIVHDLGAMAVEYDASLKGDPETIRQAIEKVFKEEFADRQLFDQWSIHTADTLFDLIVPPPKDLGAEMWRRIHEALRTAILHWVVIMPLHGVTTTSLTLGFDGVSLLAATDRDQWEEIASRYSDARLWDPLSGARRDNDPRFYGDIPSQTWLLVEVAGNGNDANEKAYRNGRTFIAVLFFQGPDYSVARNRYSHHTASLRRCATMVCRSVACTGRAVEESHDRVTFHSLRDHDELERFIHFFVALDALFGVRGDVEKTIVAGIQEAFDHDGAWSLRASKLFDLRNELLHGGSSSIVDWKDLAWYTRHFRSDPLRDVGAAAMTSLVRYFSLPNRPSIQPQREEGCLPRYLAKVDGAA